jgi:hypothetical protein
MHPYIRLSTYVCSFIFAQVSFILVVSFLRRWTMTIVAKAMMEKKHHLSSMTLSELCCSPQVDGKVLCKVILGTEDYRLGGIHSMSAPHQRRRQNPP